MIVADDLKELEKFKEVINLEKEVFDRARSRIKDEDGNWPDKLIWGWIENRYIIRVLLRGADNLWIAGFNDDALEIYRHLLRMNFSDNVGARNAILGLRMGLIYDEYINEVWPKATMPADHVIKWFNKNVKPYAEEFQDWKKCCIKEIGLEEKDFAF